MLISLFIYLFTLSVNKNLRNHFALLQRCLECSYS
uniref:Uncharacterized protein n=1 Tax=Rhizophora mucronata TaxID=61149 RepID=A0A2P2PTN3_RHIMU